MEITDIETIEGKAKLTFPSESGKSYDIQRAQDIPKQKWETLAVVPATGSSTTWTDDNPPDIPTDYRTRFTQEFYFIDDQVSRLFGNDVPFFDYVAKTNTAVDYRNTFYLIHSHLYTNALATIVLTHRWVLENNENYRNKARGLLNNYMKFQYTPANQAQMPPDFREKFGLFPHGAFPNQIVSEYYNHAEGAMPTYMGDFNVRNGNNSWYLIALCYYTLKTRDDDFVQVIADLADYISSPAAQNQQPDDPTMSPTVGAITFGYDGDNEEESENQSMSRRNNISTEHQTEAYAGLMYAAKVSEELEVSEIITPTKRDHYRESAENILKFVGKMLWNPSNANPPGSEDQSFFHTGLKDVDGSFLEGLPPSLDAQAWTNLAFGRLLKDGGGNPLDISSALDYAWDHMYFRVDDVVGKSQTVPPGIGVGGGAVWYRGDMGTWLTGSAELAFAFSYTFCELGGTEQDRIRGKRIFNDMGLTMWPADVVNDESPLEFRWPAGGFQTFSDGYVVHAPGEGQPGEGDKCPGIEATAWRYFDLYDFNPYDVDAAAAGLKG